ncbi:TolC family protein [Methylobacillus gramineus]|uniref:TolC family protein n=1 Tax=Methylobacillus gramineus TaxID=755169 RepID=UPI001CFFB52B|nr:TolC family protein [Methylobacillus gramineus]MCB5183903.1 TolC family protein [Methylobacillus gramineus]
MNAKRDITMRGSAALLLLLSLSACTSFSRDGGFDDVKQGVGKHLKQTLSWERDGNSSAETGERVKELLAQPLSVDNAVQLALLNNKGLQASYAELGIAEADLVQAGRLPNPRFSMLYARNDGDYKIEQAFTMNVFAFITMPKATEIERRRFEQTKQAVSLAVIQRAQVVRRAWVHAVAANQAVSYAAQVQQSAEAAAELARRMYQQGNWSKLDQAREQGFYADAALEYARAREQQVNAQEELARSLGLADRALFTLPAHLPDLPSNEASLLQIEKNTFDLRLDLQAQRLEVETLAKRLGLTKTTRFINVLELGPARVLEGRRGDAYKNGVEVAFELPLFDAGNARVARAEAMYMEALNHTAQVVVDAQSEVRQAYNSYGVRYEIARHYRDEIVPLRHRILQENQLRYNGMLVSAFDLLADVRTQVGSVNQYIAALRDFWLAEADLELATVGPLALAVGNRKE